MVVRLSARRGPGLLLLTVFVAASLGFLAACASASPKTEPKPQPASPLSETGSRAFDITERMQVVNRGEGVPDKQSLWVALIGDAEPYQSVESMEISPQPDAMVSDEFGNRYAEFDLSKQEPGSIPITVNYRVLVHEVVADLGDCEGEMPTEFTQAELHIESENPQIMALAADLSEGKTTACEKVRAFYDYVGDELVYTYNGRDWGAQAALGQMGADCTEYSDLLIALSRAAGIPARYVEGILYLVNVNTEVARTEHAWVEVYLPGSGWTPLDPTLGRSSLTREQYFGRLSADHVVVTRGRNPSTLRGSSYFSHLYWPGNSTDIRIEDFGWEIKAVDE